MLVVLRVAGGIVLVRRPAAGVRHVDGAQLVRQVHSGPQVHLGRGAGFHQKDGAVRAEATVWPAPAVADGSWRGVPQEGGPIAGAGRRVGAGRRLAALPDAAAGERQAGLDPGTGGNGAGPGGRQNRPGATRPGWRPPWQPDWPPAPAPLPRLRAGGPACPETRSSTSEPLPLRGAPGGRKPGHRLASAGRRGTVGGTKTDRNFNVKSGSRECAIINLSEHSLFS